MVFQEAAGYQAPTWPPVEGEQRPMMHFDFQVGDLDSAVADAVALGATLATAQPNESSGCSWIRPVTRSACAWTTDKRTDRRSGTWRLNLRRGPKNCGAQLVGTVGSSSLVIDPDVVSDRHGREVAQPMAAMR